MPTTRRWKILDRADPGQAAPERPWWTLKRPWPIDTKFEDGETERAIDRDPLPLPVLPGMYGSTAELCATSRFAEGEYDDRVSGG